MDEPPARSTSIGDAFLKAVAKHDQEWEQLRESHRLLIELRDACGQPVSRGLPEVLAKVDTFLGRA